MQLMVIEFFRNVAGYKDAGSEEFNPSVKSNVIIKMDNTTEAYGGNMRLGKYKIQLSNSKVKEIYQEDLIHERHRHRYTVNQKYKKILTMNGLNVVGKCPDSDLIEIVELNQKKYGHPWYIGTQFHPEYQSSPFNPHPLFLSFIQHCIKSK